MRDVYLTQTDVKNDILYTHMITCINSNNRLKKIKNKTKPITIKTIIMTTHLQSLKYTHPKERLIACAHTFVFEICPSVFSSDKSAIAQVVERQIHAKDPSRPGAFYVFNERK